MKKKIKRFISGLIVSAMALEAIPLSAFASEAKVLDYVIPETGAEKVISVATASTDVNEGKSYVLTFARNESAGEASFKLKTVDISAKYGEDYVIKGFFGTEVKNEGQKTLLEQSADSEEQQMRKETVKEEMLEAKAEYDDTVSGKALDVRLREEIVQETPEETEFTNNESISGSFDDVFDYDKISESGEVSLAALKQAQTGKATRKTSNTEFAHIEDLFTQDMRDNFGDILETSSETLVTFKDGETLAQVEIEILEDSISEGSEVADFVISDASEGYSIGSSINCSLTINDNDKKEKSVISFSDKSYISENGTIEVKAIRSGAEYSLATAVIRTIEDGSAKSGENYASVSKTIEFAPYVTEQSVNIPVFSEKEASFTVELCEIKGADAGDILSCKATIMPQEKYSPIAEEKDDIKLMEDDDHEEFSITLGGRDYTVKYDTDSNVGDIIDTNVTPEVTVGKYFFPYPVGTKGGTFSYGIYSGNNPGWRGSRESHYVSAGDADDDDAENPTGAAYLYYYSAKTSHKGMSIADAGNGGTFFNTTPYQYSTADWRERASFGGGQRVDFYLNKGGSGLKDSEETVYGEFGRTADNTSIKFLNKSGTPADIDINMRVRVNDDTSGRTPKDELYVYGITAMYREYKIELIQPAEMQFLKADGSFESRKPANVFLAEGHEKRYYGQKLQMNIKGTDNEDIYGVIDHYRITIGDGKTTKSFDYVPSSTEETSKNSSTISFNDSFVHLVALNTPIVEETGKGFITKMSIQPVFKYKDVSVEVRSSSNGYFEMGNISTGTHSFHQGDKISLKGISTKEGYDYLGYHSIEYKNASDTLPVSDAVYFSSTTDQSDMVMTLNEEKYILEPVFMQANYIGVKLTDSAKQYLNVSNLVHKNALNDEMKHSLETNGLEYVLKTDIQKNDMDANAYSLNTGVVYTMEAKSKDDRYRPVFRASAKEALKVVGNSFDYIVNSAVDKNIITIDAEAIPLGNASTFAVSGYAVMPYSSVRSSGVEMGSSGVSGVMLYANGEYMTSADNKTMLSRLSATSDGSGFFKLNGIKGYDNDTVSIKIDDGNSQSVQYITLNSTGLAEKDISYTKPVKDESGKYIDTPVIEHGYELNLGNVELPVRTGYVPYVSSITYTVDPIKDFDYDTRNNEIAILATYANITANVVTNGRNVESAIFRTIHTNGTYEDMEVKSEKEHQREFTVRYKLDTSFQPGDLLYVMLKDKEERYISTQGVDETTGEQIRQESYEDIIYTPIFTGLSFYVPSLETEPQTYDFENTESVNVPLLGDVAASQKTGGISFNKTYYGSETQANRPYTLSFYFSPGYSTIATQTAGTTLGNINKGKTSAAQQLKNTPAAEEEQLTANLIDMFNESGSGMGQAGFDKKYNSLGFKKSLSNITKQTPFDIHALLLLSFDFMFDNESNEYVMTSCQYFLGANFTVAKCMYTSVYGVPVYLKLSGSLGLGYWGLHTTDEGEDIISSTNFTNTSNIALLTANKDAGYITTTFGGNAAVGVGLCGVVGAKGIVNASIAAKFNAERLNNIPAANSGEIKETEPLEGFLFKFGGGFGIDLLLFTLEYTPTLLTYGAGCYKKVAENSGSIIVLSQDANAGVRKAVDNGTSDMSSFGNNVQFMSGKDYTVNTLLSNARERTKPDIETLPDGRKMIVFLGNDANAAENNKCCLMYAIADKNGNWGVVQKVDGNGTNDILPQIVTFKDKAAVIWSDSNKVFDKDALPRDMLGSFEVAYRVFDCSTDTWGEKTVITNDGFMDTCAGFALNEDTNKLTCFYLKRDLQKAETDQELADINATYSTIAYKEYDINAKVWNTDEIYLDIKHDRITDPLIIDFSAKADKIDENNYIWMTYTVDEDENLQTSEDREVYAILRNVDGDTNAYPIRVTNNVFSDSNPALTKYNDEVYLSWLQDGKILKMADLTGIIKFLKENGHFDDYFEKTEKGIYKKSAGEIGISAEEYKKSVFDYLAKENLAGIEKNFRTEEYIDRSIGNYRLYSDSNNGLYLFWTEAGYTTSGKEQDPKTAELYAAIYEEDGGWGNSVKITDLGKYIDEFDIAFDGNDGMSAVSNLYSINIAESGEISYSSNDLVEIDFVKKTSLSPEKLSVNGIIRAGETVEISFDAVNNGLKSSGAYSVTAEYVSEGKSAVIFSKDEVAGLRSGECISYNFAFDIPSDVKDGAVKVTVTDNNTGQSESITEDVKAVSSIKVENENIYFDDERKPCISVKISNNSDTESGNIVLSANLPTDITKIYGSYEVGTLKGGESREVIYTLEDFDPKTDLERFGTANITNNCSEDNVKLSDNVLKLFALDAAELVIENDTDTISLAKGEEYIINASVVPANIANRTVTFSTDNDRVAIVTSEGKIIPVGNGTAVITVSHTSSGLKKTITVNASGFAEGTSESTTEEAHSETTTQSSTGGSGRSSGNGKSSSKASAKATENGDKDESTNAASNKPMEEYNGFSDVKGLWCEKTVNELREKGIVNGRTATLFAPNDNLTRAELVQFLANMKGVDLSTYKNKTSKFTDVSKNAWYYAAVAWAEENNIIYGVAPDKFAPEKNISREDTAVIIYRYMGITADTNAKIFADSASISGYAKEAVDTLSSKGIINGYPDNSFKPKNTVTRAETASILDNITE